MADYRADALRFIKYAATGLLNTAVDSVVFALLMVGGMSLGLSQTFAYGCGMLTSYFVNRRWTFGGGRFGGASVLRFIAVNLGLLVLSLAVIYLASERLGAPLAVAKAAAIACTVSLGFAANRLWVFRPPASDRGEPPTDTVH